tara:strand:- start:1927 stop:2301 length:375 start_codon:yes stop_codon:yes gene_type:complete
MKNLKNILKRSVKNGFDLSFVQNYNEKKLLQGVYEFLVKNHYYCSMEDDVVYVGINVVEDIAEITIQNRTMKVKPLIDRGFFEVLVSLFKYVKHLSSFIEEVSEEDIPTETDDEDEESSGEMWL